MRATVPILIKRAAHQHQCDWCGELINKGFGYHKWTVFHERVDTCRLHPECYDAMEEVRERDPHFNEWTPGSFSRGETD